jgi:hypothetical protein
MREHPEFIVIIVAAALLAGAAFAGWPKSTARAPEGIATSRLERGIYPLEIMRNAETGRLPIERFRDGECPDRC